MEVKKALVIDDDEDVNELMCVMLENAGFQTTAAYNGDEGLKKALDFSPDVILLDIMMPGLDGIGVCRVLRSMEETKNIPIIMVTAKTGLSDKLLGYITGANRYIVKPFDLEHLLMEIEIAMQQHKTICERGFQSEF